MPFYAFAQAATEWMRSFAQRTASAADTKTHFMCTDAGSAEEQACPLLQGKSEKRGTELYFLSHKMLKDKKASKNFTCKTDLLLCATGRST